MMDEIQPLIVLFLWPFKADASSASEMKLIDSCKSTYRARVFKTLKVSKFVSKWIDQICKAKLAQNNSEKSRKNIILST